MEKLSLPSMEHNFHILSKGNETGRHYEGEFTYHRPNLHQKAEITKMATRLDGDLKNLPLEVHIFNEMCAVLSLCVVKAPEWWYDSNSGRDLYDMNVLEEVYKECMVFEQEWIKKVWGNKNESDKPKKNRKK